MMEDTTQSSKEARPPQETGKTVDDRADTQSLTPVYNQPEPHALCYQTGLSFVYFHVECAPEDAETEPRRVPFSKFATWATCYHCKKLFTETEQQHGAAQQTPQE